MGQAGDRLSAWDAARRPILDAETSASASRAAANRVQLHARPRGWAQAVTARPPPDWCWKALLGSCGPSVGCRALGMDGTGWFGRGRAVYCRRDPGRAITNVCRDAIL